MIPLTSHPAGPTHHHKEAMNAPFKPDKTYRWTNFPRKASRRSLRRSAEGTLANIGLVVRSGQNPYPPRIRIPIAYRAKNERYRPAKPKSHGPIVRRVPLGTPPPTCIHCAGPTELVANSTNAVHIERCERKWICRNTECLGHRDAVIYKTPLGEYERRC